LRGLGVTEVVPREGDVGAAVRERFPDGVHALLDLINYAPGAYDAALKPSVRVASPTGAAGEDRARTNVMSTPSPENLQRVGALLADGTVQIRVQATYELAQAPEALSAPTGQHTQGKLAIRIR
jgi:NADPH:quinone reductase-like Zn-dependent oxidoreductase